MLAHYCETLAQSMEGNVFCQSLYITSAYEFIELPNDNQEHPASASLNHIISVRHIHYTVIELA